MTDIRLATASNVRGFQALVHALAASDAKWKEQLNQEGLEDEYGRFRVWSGNLGALQKGHSSLDYRLRDSPLLAGNALKFLEELSSNLNEALAIVSGARLPYEEHPQSDSDEKIEEEENDDGFFSEDDEDEAGGSKRELTMRYEEVVDIIDNLYKLSVRIRTPTIRSRSLKAATYQPKDPETGIDILSTYALYDQQHTRELLRNLRQGHETNLQEVDDYLVTRLAHGITLRRRHFKYWKRHRDKLSVSTVVEESVVYPERPIEQAKSPIHIEAEVTPPQAPVALKEATSQRTGKTMLSGTEATHHHQSLDDIVDAKSVTSYAATVKDIHGRGVDLPPPPKTANCEKDFECPYCYIICPSRYGRGRSWRTHLLQDLQPYMCTYSDCEASEQLFRSRREWNEHEAGHRKAWRCLEHPSAVYKSPAGLENHLRQEHLNNFPESQLDTIVKVGETSTVEVREKCPICFLPAVAGGMGDFASHVANHLERFAAFALPKSSEEDSDAASSVASCGRSGTSSQDMSGMSLPSEASDAQDQDEALTKEPQRTDEHTPFEKGEPQGDISYAPLSMQSLQSLPDVSHSRLHTLMADRATEIEDDEDDEQQSQIVTTDVEEHVHRMEAFRTHLMALPGARSVRFFKRYGSWRGYAIFNSAALAAEAMDLFDKDSYPNVKIQQGVDGSSNKLKFSVPESSETRWEGPTRQLTSDTHNTDNTDNWSNASSPMAYDDPSIEEGKAPVISASDIPTLRDMYRARKLLQRDQSFAPNDSYNRIISFCYHDLTRLSVDAIVNSANVSMKASKSATTLNRSIHKAGGPRLTEEAAAKGRLKSGQAAMTGGYNLPCAHVIHAARPQYGANKGMGQFNILTECYRSALRIAQMSGLKTVAFPCLGAGGCGFPPRVAARVALQEVREYLDYHQNPPFERIIFVVQTASDEKAYTDLFPVFFPPTHGDLEVARSSEPSASRASLAAEVLEARLQVQKVAQDLSAELSLFIADFPQQVLVLLHSIDAALASIRGFLLGSKILDQSLEDLNLLCSVMQSICGSVTELTESAKAMPFSGGRSHKGLWDDYNNHQRMVYDSDLENLLRDCQDFAQYLEDILTRNGVVLDEMAPVRLRLDSFRARQKGQDTEGAREHLDEVLYAREFQREAYTENRDIVRLHQVRSVSQLYSSNILEEKSTMVNPSIAFNDKVCLIREDITKLEVAVMVSCTDVTFAGMGTLDRKVFNKGGMELREACTKLGICKEGDVKTTLGFELPAKHILHVVPPKRWGKQSKDVLRRIYREILHTAQSLRATSLAIPAIGTGKLTFPRRDCAAIALEEVNRFLETAEPTNSIEKIVFVTYSSNDDFIYKSLLPVYFPPVDRNVNRALPASHPFPKKEPASPETISAPKRTLFSSIGDAVRNLGGSSSRKRPVAHTWRNINTYEEHALIGFESHAQDCKTCKDLDQLYQEKRNLCEHGYPLAQTLLWYMNLGPDQLVYTRPVQIRQSIRLEVPGDTFPLSLIMLRQVEASLREEGREPFVSPNRAYSTVVHGQSAQQDEPSGPTIYNAETARASVEVRSSSEQQWSPVSPGECIVFIRQGRLDVYEAHTPSTAQEPLLMFVVDPASKVTRPSHRDGLVVRGARAAQFDNDEEIMLVSQSKADSESLLAMLHRANPEFPVNRDDLETTSKGRSVRGTDRAPAGKARPDLEQEHAMDAQDSLQRSLSPLQAKMQKLSEAASKFDSKAPEQQSATLAQLGDSTDPPIELRQNSTPQDCDSSTEETLTALEHQILHYLTEDLKTRPGSFIGQSTKNIAAALERPLEEVITAATNLSRQDYIHNTINSTTWVVSRIPANLPVLADQSEDSPRLDAASSEVGSVSKAEKTDILFQMDLLEQQILSYLSKINSASPLWKGCTAAHLTEALEADVHEVELALDQLAEQGKVHLAPDRETWNTPLPRQYIPPNIPSQGAEKANPEQPTIRGSTEFKDTPPSPVLPTTSTHTTALPADLESSDLDESSFYPYDPSTRWTRIDASYVDPQVLADLDEEFHKDGYSLVVHRTLRRGELKDWVQKTLDLRLQKSESTDVRKGAGGHGWLSKGKGRDGRDERDLRQANLDRVLAGDMKEDEIRHFKRDEDAEKRG